MKSVMIVLLAFVALAASQGVHVVDNNPSHVHVVDNNPSHVHVVDNNPSHVHVVDNNPSHVHVVDNNPSHVHVVDNNPSHVHVVDNNPSHVHVVDNNPSHVQVVEEADNQNSFNQGNFAPDPGFAIQHNPNNGYEQISTGPAFVDQGTFQNRPYPYIHNSDPALRSGK
ncbi:uncharacterized protein LOC126774768 isoform X2 [Nymphalis io]|uniref:uncharacterized protein LOC126774768 isoform X2 n=1 Tax=Inachis io TaxID=171585 RepID=UPI00216749D6|nr:uncharacterized protein LOC126774768 isoform X2 [Nymphalis io]